MDWDDIVSAVSSAWDTVCDDVSEAAESVWDTAMSCVDTVGDWFSDMSDKLSHIVNNTDKNEARKLVGRSSEAQKLISGNSTLSSMWDNIRDSFEMVAKVFSGEFTDYAWTDFAWVVGGLSYLLWPLDAIPDVVPVAGLMDDAGALGMAFARSGTLLKSYRAFAMGKYAVVVDKVADNLGVKASFEETLKRLVSSSPAAFEPRPGTPLLVSLAGVLEHSGLYLGDGEVAEVYDDSDEGGKIRKVPLYRFLCGDGNFPRVGDVVYAACSKNTGGKYCPLCSETAVEHARAFMRRNSKVAYNIMRSNCHMFTASCLLGRELYVNRNYGDGIGKGMALHTASCLAALTTGTFSIAKLTNVVKRTLSDDQKVEWCPVASWNRDSLKRHGKQTHTSTRTAGTMREDHKVQSVVSGTDEKVNVELLAAGRTPKRVRDWFVDAMYYNEGYADDVMRNIPLVILTGIQRKYAEKYVYELRMRGAKVGIVS